MLQRESEGRGEIYVVGGNLTSARKSMSNLQLLPDHPVTSVCDVCIVSIISLFCEHKL